MSGNGPQNVVTMVSNLSNTSGNGSGYSATGTSESNAGTSIDKLLWIYVSPVILTIGLCGNTLTIVVMRQKRMRGTSTCVYLTLMAIADLGTLITGIIPEWLEMCGFVIFKELHPWTCKMEKFLFYTINDVAIWIIVAFTLDRFVAVCFPLKKREVCVPKRAAIACLCITLVAIAKNLHVFWTRGRIYDENGNVIKNCGRPSDFENYVRPWIAFALVSLVPFLIISVCNAGIIRALVIAKRRMRDSVGENARALTQTTAMCLSASFTFLVLIAPSIVLLIGKPYWTSYDNPNPSYDIAKAIINQLVYVNHSINFFLYCLTGARFRDELLSVLCRQTHGRKNTMAMSYTTCHRQGGFDSYPTAPLTEKTHLGLSRNGMDSESVT